MLGGTRNGRALKLALLVGLVLLTLYFLVSWKMEAQTLSTNLALAEQEYEKIVGKYNKLEKGLTGEQLVINTSVDGGRALTTHAINYGTYTCVMYGNNFYLWYN